MNAIAAYLSILLACAGFASVAAHWCWVRFRVLLLRERLFLSRDRLFLAAHERGMLDDPAYRAARRRFNAFIAGAGCLSMGTMSVLANARRPNPESPASRDPEWQAIVDAEMAGATELIAHYLRHHTLAGQLVSLVARPAREFEDLGARSVVASVEPDRLKLLNPRAS